MAAAFSKTQEGLLETALDGRLRQYSCNDLRLKVAFAVCRVAERHVLALSAAAKGNSGPAPEVKLPTILVVQLEVSFDLYTAIRFDDDLCRHRYVSWRGITGGVVF